MSTPINRITVSNEIWRIVLPADWARQDAGANAQVYFESRDGSKGVYLLASNAPGLRSDAERLEQRNREYKILQRMEQSSWEILTTWLKHEGEIVRFGMDCYDRKKFYRIVVEQLDGPEFSIRLSLHDYDCDDLVTSQGFIDTTLRSFGFDG